MQGIRAREGKCLDYLDNLDRALFFNGLACPGKKKCLDSLDRLFSLALWCFRGENPDYRIVRAGQQYPSAHFIALALAHILA